MYNIIKFKDFSKTSKYNRYFISLGENEYVFTVYFDTRYGGCAYMDIADSDNNPIISGRALVNGLKIRNHNIPYVLYFVQLNGETYEPTIDNISTEFGLVYNDEEEVV